MSPVMSRAATPRAAARAPLSARRAARPVVVRAQRDGAEAGPAAVAVAAAAAALLGFSAAPDAAVAAAFRADSPIAAFGQGLKDKASQAADNAGDAADKAKGGLKGLARDAKSNAESARDKAADALPGNSSNPFRAASNQVKAGSTKAKAANATEKVTSPFKRVIKDAKDNAKAAKERAADAIPDEVPVPGAEKNARAKTAGPISRNADLIKPLEREGAPLGNATLKAIREGEAAFEKNLGVSDKTDESGR